MLMTIVFYFVTGFNRFIKHVHDVHNLILGVLYVKGMFDDAIQLACVDGMTRLFVRVIHLSLSISTLQAHACM